MGKKKRKINRGEIPIHVFEQAAIAKRAGASGRSGAKQFGIDQTTFRRIGKRLPKAQQTR